jgi:hypothetical protein
VLVATICLLSVGPARACDLCAVYLATTGSRTATGPSIAIAEQYTSFNTLQLDGEKIPNFDGEWLQSSITQIVLGYTAHPRVHLQANVPFITRSFRRVGLTGIETGSETGVGDVSLALRGSAVQWSTINAAFHWDLMLGVKLPTGDTDRLGEETVDAGGEGAASRPRHDNEGGPLSGVHGHDLTLGTGSVDLLLGTSVFASLERFFVRASVQYLVRGDGDYGYRYANDLQWNAALGAFLYASHQHALALEALTTGETKGQDVQSGTRLDDTAVTAAYVGPMLDYSYGTRLNAELGFTLPVYQHTTSLQILPDYRLLGALTWRF